MVSRMISPWCKAFLGRSTIPKYSGCLYKVFTLRGKLAQLSELTYRAFTFAGLATSTAGMRATTSSGVRLTQECEHLAYKELRRGVHRRMLLSGENYRAARWQGVCDHFERCAEDR